MNNSDIFNFEGFSNNTFKKKIPHDKLEVDKINLNILNFLLNILKINLNIFKLIINFQFNLFI